MRVQSSLERSNQAAGVRTLRVDFGAMPQALADLAKELFDIEATGSRGVEKLVQKYDVMPTELQLSLKAASKVPVTGPGALVHREGSEEELLAVSF
jgi:hypothetical protein